MYLIISCFFLTEKFLNYSGKFLEQQRNWKIEKRFSPETSRFLHKLNFCFAFRDYSGVFAENLIFFRGNFRKRFSKWMKFFSFGSLLPEDFRKKNEKLKDCFFQRHPGTDSSYGFSFSFFQFFFAEWDRNNCLIVF